MICLSFTNEAYPQPMIKAVAFDLDGLMFNTEEIFHEAGVELMRRHGCEMTDEFFTLIMGRRAEEGYPLLVEAAGLSVDPMKLWRESHDLFLAMLDEQISPMPGLFELLDPHRTERLAQRGRDLFGQQVPATHPHAVRDSRPLPHDADRRGCHERQATPGDLPQGRRSAGGRSARDAGSGRQPQRQQSRRRRWGVHHFRSAPAQSKSGFRPRPSCGQQLD